MTADYCHTVAAIAMVSIIEAAFIVAAVMIDVEHVALKTLALIISAFLGIFWLGFTVAVIGGSTNLESSIEDELTKGLLPKNKD
jgi:uncharacterized membrane protein